MAEGLYQPPARLITKYKPRLKGNADMIKKAVAVMAAAKRPVFYCGGGIVNSGPAASQLLTKLIRLSGYPCTLTLMGLGVFPASDPQYLGMLGMHGTYEANLAMHACDVLICVGARFDDRITGRLDAFSPDSTKIHIDIDPSSINKNVKVDIPIVGDAGHVLEDMLKIWRATQAEPDRTALKAWWQRIDDWRATDCLKYNQGQDIIKPQHAIQRLYDITRAEKKNVFITTEVGQHQMWAAQFFRFDQPNRWMTSGGLGTMGYGLPAAMGVQVAHPHATVIDIAGEASFLMNMQELSTIQQYRLPVKSFILNNFYMGMVRQWQELLHGGRYSESYMESLPDFVKLADAFGMVGLRATRPDELDDVIGEMIASDRPVIADIQVDPAENCFPMIPSGAAHNEMLLGPEDKSENPVSEEGMVLV